VLAHDLRAALEHADTTPVVHLVVLRYLSTRGSDTVHAVEGLRAVAVLLEELRAEQPRGRRAVTSTANTVSTRYCCGACNDPMPL
jgi:hypothetical protein